MARKRPLVSRAEIKRIRERVMKTAPESARRVSAEIARCAAQTRIVDPLVIEILRQPVDY